MPSGKKHEANCVAAGFLVNDCKRTQKEVDQGVKEYGVDHRLHVNHLADDRAKPVALILELKLREHEFLKDSASAKEVAEVLLEHLVNTRIMVNNHVCEDYLDSKRRGVNAKFTKRIEQEPGFLQAVENPIQKTRIPFNPIVNKPVPENTPMHLLSTKPRRTITKGIDDLAYTIVEADEGCKVEYNGYTGHMHYPRVIL